MEKGISASVMCINFADTKRDLDEIRNAGIRYLHFDIMDGVFVPNYALGACIANGLRKAADMPFDYHFMVEGPEKKIGCFDFRPGDAVSVHAEATDRLRQLIIDLKGLGVTAGAALKPETDINALEGVFDVLDYVLVMTVDPGFGGQPLVESAIGKIAELREKMPDMAIQVDGCVSFENARRMKAAGADCFVAGTAGLFRKDMAISEAAERLNREIC